MASSDDGFVAFGGQSIHEYSEECRRAIYSRVWRLTATELSGSDEVGLVARLTAERPIHAPTIDFDHVTPKLVPTDEAPVHEHFPRGRGPRQWVEYTLQVTGDAGLLRIAPQSTHMLGANGLPKVFNRSTRSNGAIAFYIGDFGDENAMKQARDAVLDNLRVNSKQLALALESYAPSIPSEVRTAIAQEKERREQERQRNERLLS